jgi:hypothetical protein
VCSVFRLDHHSAVQFLLRFLVHPKAEIFISIRFCPVVFNEMLYTPKALLFNFKKTDKCMSVHWFVRILFRCHQFSLELCLDFVWRTLGLFVFYLWFQWNLLSKLPIKLRLTKWFYAIWLVQSWKVMSCDVIKSVTPIKPHLSPTSYFFWNRKKS